MAVRRVISRLKGLGSTDPKLREAPINDKVGPVKTDQGFFLIDAPFPKLLVSSDVAQGQDGSGSNGIWEVEALAKAIKEIQGVLDVGLFTGLTGPKAQESGKVGGQKPVAAYFGMPDGSVTSRASK